VVPGAGQSLTETVRAMLDELALGREAAALRMARDFDGWTGPVDVSPKVIAAASARVPQDQRDAILWAHDNIRAFALAQRASATDIAVELRLGLWAGHLHMAVAAVGCHVPDVRYAHVASALVSVATARAAGIGHIVAVTPPLPGAPAGAPAGVPDAVQFALQVAGADRVLVLGAVRGVAAFAYGLFGLPRADFLAGPGNPFVAEAKRLLYGLVGIDIGGAEPCAAHGGAARNTGGLSVLKFLRTVTWQRVEPAALTELARAGATISRIEGMEGHARSAEIRLSRFAL